MIDLGKSLPEGQTVHDTAERGARLAAQDAEWLVTGTRGSQSVERTISASSHNEAILKASKTPPIMVPHGTRLIESPSEKAAAQQKAQAAYRSLTGK